jgi:hypothetical protein
LEHTTFDRGQHLNVLVRMLRDVYGVTGPVVETPPRPALKRFGGVFDPADVPKAHCRIVTPPFVSYCMLLEEHGDETTTEMPSVLQESAMEGDDSIGEPPPPAAFDEYMAKRIGGGNVVDAEVVAGRRKRATTAARGGGGEGSSSSGPMSKFCRR